MFKKAPGAYNLFPLFLVLFLGLSCGSDKTGPPSSFADADGVADVGGVEIIPEEPEVFDFGAPEDVFDFGGGGEGLIEQCTVAPYELY